MLLSKGVVNGVLLLAAFYMLMPVSWLLFAATKNHRDLFATGGFSFGDFNLFANIHDVLTFNDGIYLRWFGNSLLYSVVGSAASALLCTATGYAFDKYDFRGKEKLFGLVLGGVLVPATVIQLPMYLLASKVGVVNTYWGNPAAGPGQPVRCVSRPGLLRGIRTQRGPRRRRGWTAPASSVRSAGSRCRCSPPAS